MFCAAVPAAAAMGAAAQSKQQKARQAAKARGEQPPKLRLPAAQTTAIVIIGLVTAAAIYHAKQPG
jgi:hypothetical protein